MNININEFLQKFKDKYNFIYEAEEGGNYVAGYDEAVTAFDKFAKAHGDFIGEFAKFRGDFISSDREAAAFMFALSDY